MAAGATRAPFSGDLESSSNGPVTTNLGTLPATVTHRTANRKAERRNDGRDWLWRCCLPALGDLDWL